MNKQTPVKNALTARQAQCAEYLLKGKTAKEIALILNLSRRTVEYYIENIKSKFDCRSRAELILTLSKLLDTQYC